VRVAVDVDAVVAVAVAVEVRAAHIGSFPLTYPVPKYEDAAVAAAAAAAVAAAAAEAVVAVGVVVVVVAAAAVVADAYREEFHPDLHSVRTAANNDGSSDWMKAFSLWPEHLGPGGSGTKKGSKDL
jgi:hypothetical protein